MPLANTPAVLHLLDGPVGVDPAHHIIQTRFRVMRRYLALWPEEFPRIFRMFNLIAHGADGHGPVHLLLLSDAEIGFAWDGEESGWIRAALSLFGCWLGLFSIFRALSLMPGSSKLVLGWRNGRDSVEVSF